MYVQNEHVYVDNISDRFGFFNVMYKPTKNRFREIDGHIYIFGQNKRRIPLRSSGRFCGADYFLNLLVDCDCVQSGYYDSINRRIVFYWKYRPEDNHALAISGEVMTYSCNWIQEGF